MTHKFLIELPKICTRATKGVLTDHLLLISCKFWREISLAALKIMTVLVIFFFKFSCSNLVFGKRSLPFVLNMVQLITTRLVDRQGRLLHTLKLPQSDFNLAVHV